MRTPGPVSDESPRSYLLRLSEANGYEGCSAIIDCVGPSSDYVVTAGWDYSKLQPLLGPCVALPSSLGYHMNGRGSRGTASLLGNSIRAGHLGLTRARLCVQCVMERGYVHAACDLKAYTACPTHGTMMLKNCHICGKRILYARRGLLVCQCGANLRDARAEPAPPELLAVCEVLHAKLHGSRDCVCVAEVLGVPVETLLRMDLEVLLRVVVMLARICMIIEGGSSSPCKDAEISRFLPLAGDALCAFPAGFHALLHRWHVRDNVDRQVGSFQQQFAWLFARLHKNLGASAWQTDRFVEAALRYAARHWDKSPLKVRGYFTKFELPRVRVGNAVDTAKALGIPSYTAQRLLERGGLPGVKRSSAARWIVDIDRIRSIEISSGAGLGQRKMARRLGLPHAITRYLVKKGVICQQRVRLGHGVPMEDAEAFERQVLSAASLNEPDGISVELGTILLAHAPLEVRVQVLLSVLSGDLPAFRGLARRIPEIRIGKAAYTRVLEEARQRGAFTVHQAMKRFRLSYFEAIAVFARLGITRARRSKSVGAPCETISRFLEKHVPVRRVASSIGLVHRWFLRSVSESSKIKLVPLQVPGYDNMKAWFLRQEDVAAAKRLARRLAASYKSPPTAR